jgi:hypothetical protein
MELSKANIDQRADGQPAYQNDGRAFQYLMASMCEDFGIHIGAMSKPTATTSRRSDVFYGFHCKSAERFEISFSTVLEQADSQHITPFSEL